MAKFKNYKRLLAEYPYLKTLPEKDRLYLIQFAKEYDSAYFQKEIGHLHNSKELRKKVDDARNAARRDVMNKHLLVPYKEESEE